MMVRMKTYQEKGTEIEVPQCASWDALSRSSAETKRTTELVLETDKSNSPYARSSGPILYDVFVGGW
jgi:hypothetical protein